MKRFLTPENLAIFLVIIAIISRLIPHPFNFTPILAIALFAGFMFQNKIKAFLVPAAALILSNLILSYSAISWIVVGIVALITGMGFLMKNRHSWGWVLGFSIGGSLVFFILSNFGVWAISGMYPLTFEGLMASYEAGIPFYRFTLASTVLYSLVLFEGHKLLSNGAAKIIGKPA